MSRVWMMLRPSSLSGLVSARNSGLEMAMKEGRQKVEAGLKVRKTLTQTLKIVSTAFFGEATLGSAFKMAATINTDLLQKIRRSLDPPTWRSFDAASCDVRRQSAAFVQAFRTRLERLLCLASQGTRNVSTIFVNLYTPEEQDIHNSWQVQRSWLDEFNPEHFDMGSIGLFWVEDFDSVKRMVGPTADILSFFTPHVRRAWDMEWTVNVKVYGGGVELAQYESPDFPLSFRSTALAPLANDRLHGRERFSHRLRQLVNFVRQDSGVMSGEIVGARYGSMFVLRDELGPSGDFYYVCGLQSHTGSVDECLALCTSFYDEEESEPSLHLRGDGWNWMADTEELARFFPPDYDLAGVFKLLQ